MAPVGSVGFSGVVGAGGFGVVAGGFGEVLQMRRQARSSVVGIRCGVDRAVRGRRLGGFGASAGLAAARRLGRTGGRPAKLTDDDLDVATTLLANPDITVAEIAERVGVSPATLYRYLPAARTANTPGV
jgi:hypothetical protein